MRVLAVSNPGVGHVNPMFPVCRALQSAGHEVRFATAGQFCPFVEAAGFRAHPAGLDWLEPEAERTFPEFETIDLEQRGAFMLQEVFADIAAHRMVPDLLALIDEWRPDLLLRNDYEFGSCVAAERASLPQATVSICFFMTASLLSAAIGDRLAYLRSAYGLRPYPATGMLYPSLYLTYAPAVLEPCAMPCMHGIRPDDVVDAEIPEMLAHLPARPLVYVSLGTVFNRKLQVFRTILDGLRDEPVNVVVTVGRNQDPLALGTQPPHIVVERYIPQDALLARAHLFITHSPFYTALSALRFGVPLLMVPQAGDQPAHALRLARHGVGLVLRDPEHKDAALRDASAELSSDAVRRAVRELDKNPHYRERAAAVGRDMRELPNASHAVCLLRALTIPGSPVHA